MPYFQELECTLMFFFIDILLVFILKHTTNIMSRMSNVHVSGKTFMTSENTCTRFLYLYHHHHSFVTTNITFCEYHYLQRGPKKAIINNLQLFK